MSKKTHEGFNSPFAGARERLARMVQETAPSPPARPAVPPPAAPRADADLFADAMAGVDRISPDPGGRVGTPPTPPSPISRRAADEAEAYAALADLAGGVGPFEMSATDEFLEFVAPGVNKQLLRRLRHGDFAVQGHVDLHGMTRERAQIAVTGFIEQARIGGKRCVLIIHGRGLNSKDQIPVLKERVKTWLERGRLSRQVLAFVSARPCDGGTGALYVLLRR